MKKTVKQITLILLSVATISSILAVITVRIFIYNPPYREFFIGFHLAVGVILMQTILATSSYLNLIKIVRNNSVYSALSFFALPFLLMTGFTSTLHRQELAFLLIEIPFFTLLLFGFLWFRKINSQ